MAVKLSGANRSRRDGIMTQCCCRCSFNSGLQCDLDKGCENNREGKSGKFPIYIATNVLDGSRMSVKEIRQFGKLSTRRRDGRSRNGKDSVAGKIRLLLHV